MAGILLRMCPTSSMWILQARTRLTNSLILRSQLQTGGGRGSGGDMGYIVHRYPDIIQRGVWAKRIPHLLWGHSYNELSSSLCSASNNALPKGFLSCRGKAVG